MGIKRTKIKIIIKTKENEENEAIKQIKDEKITSYFVLPHECHGKRVGTGDDRTKGNNNYDV